MESLSALTQVSNESRPHSCPPSTPLPPNKKRSRVSAVNLSSQKRRRLSSTLVDFENEVSEDISFSADRPTSSTADRFLSNRPKVLVPLSITPRSRRMSKQLGLIDDKVLNFGDDSEGDLSLSRSRDENTINLLRKSASSLFSKQSPSHPTSVTENLNKRKDCLAALDCPGVPKDSDAYPISWSSQNLIAVLCRSELFYQSTVTKKVSSLGPAVLNAIQWGGEGSESHLAGGGKNGSVLLWDALGSGLVRTWSRPGADAIKSCSFHRSLLAVGASSGDLVLIDTRSPGILTQISRHSSPLVGLQWNHDGRFLASGDMSGVVQVWDYTAGKSLLDCSEETKKLRHRGSARALAWCTWKPDLLATGTTAPEGKIRIWSTTLLNNQVPSPLATIPLNTSITSLHWSPHCKELLSTHGSSFTPLLQSRNPNLPASQSASPTPRTSSSKPKFTNTPLANSITVHQYPSCKRLMTLSAAHTSSISQSCLSPSGESIYTLCPREETIKLWKVWSQPEPQGKKESAFDKFLIR